MSSRLKFLQILYISRGVSKLWNFGKTTEPRASASGGHFEHGHGIALFANDVVNCCGHRWHWSRDSACCRGAPTGGDWDYPGLTGSRLGCCKLSRHSAQALVCRRLLPRGARDWSEREQQARSIRGTNKPLASSSVPVPGASHPGRRAVGSFRFLLVVPCRRQLLAEGRHIHFESSERLQSGRGVKPRSKQM